MLGSNAKATKQPMNPAGFNALEMLQWVTVIESKISQSRPKAPIPCDKIGDDLIRHGFFWVWSNPVIDWVPEAVILEKRVTNRASITQNPV
jgi:hypothetical protein